MAKKKKGTVWGDVAKGLVSAATNPTDMLMKGVDLAVDYLIEDNEDEGQLAEEEESNIDLADRYYNEKKYKKSLDVAEHAKDDYYQFYYYRHCGMCHYNLWEEEKIKAREKMDELGLDENTDDEDPRWVQMDPLFEKMDKEKRLGYESFKLCLKSVGKEDCDIATYTLAHVYWVLMDLCERNYHGMCEKRRYAIAAMRDEELFYKVKDEYNQLTDELLDYWSESQPFSCIDYYERQFIYIAKDIDSIAGCYNESIPWVFTIDSYPLELHFPAGHPQPNALYYAHPAKKRHYLPIEDADDELFNDKVRDFQRLVQCLGATDINFRSVKGHSLSESISKNYDIEVGGGFKGYEGSVGYGNKRSGSKNQSLQGQREMVQRFNPHKAPYVPDDVAWLSVDPEWQSLVKQRLEGNMLHYSIRISSRKTMAVTSSRMDDVKVAFKSFIASAHVNYSQQMERSFQREEETEWEISVVFKPLEELPPINSKNEIKTEESKESSIESYKRLRIYSCINYYCGIIIFDNGSEKPDLKRIINRVRKDTNIIINENDIKGETIEEVWLELDNYLIDKSINSFDWYGFIPTLPHENEKEKFYMNVDYESNIDNKGSALVGIVTSGSIVVGDKVLLSQYGKDSDEYECVVTWIEVNGKDVNIAKAGDSLGMGIDADFDSIGFHVECAEKSSEWEDNNGEATAEEQEYLDNLKVFLEDDAEITPRERKMLDRIRDKLGISEERAKELEKSLKPQLTEDEQEYLEMYRDYAEKGEITEKERRRLDKFASALGISEERIKEIEQSF
ncbi:MAG: hypothetical protein SPL55_03475 [Prevotella sp.]|nr:hypothetical protein [Prevotella sp.]